MLRFNPYDNRQDPMLPINLQDQMIEDTLEHAVDHLMRLGGPARPSWQEFVETIALHFGEEIRRERRLRPLSPAEGPRRHGPWGQF